MYNKLVKLAVLAKQALKKAKNADSYKPPSSSIAESQGRVGYESRQPQGYPDKAEQKELERIWGEFANDIKDLTTKLEDFIGKAGK